MGEYQFEAVLHPEEDGGYSVTVPDLPGCFTEGDTLEEAVSMAEDAMKTYVASLLGTGDVVPGPVMYGKENELDTVRISFETDESYVTEITEAGEETALD